MNRNPTKYQINTPTICSMLMTAQWRYTVHAKSQLKDSKYFSWTQISIRIMHLNLNDTIRIKRCILIAPKIYVKSKFPTSHSITLQCGFSKYISHLNAHFVVCSTNHKLKNNSHTIFLHPVFFPSNKKEVNQSNHISHFIMHNQNKSVNKCPRRMNKFI